jgi:hypothetical protein
MHGPIYRSQTPVGERRPQKLRFAASHPIRDNIHQSLLTCVVPSARIPPMQGVIHGAALHRIIVHVVQHGSVGSCSSRDYNGYWRAPGQIENAWENP